MGHAAEPALHFEVHSPPPSRLPVVIAMLLAAGVVAAVIWFVQPPATTTPHLPAMTPEAEAYAAQVEIGGLDLSRWENFLGQEVTYLDVDLTNRGHRKITALELSVDFLNAGGQTVMSQTVRPVGPGSTLARRREPLGPGEVYRFRAAFEEIPADWNRLPPRVRIAGMLLE